MNVYNVTHSQNLVGRHCFFGYYNMSPWNASGDCILTHVVDFIDHLPNGNEFADIQLVDVVKNVCKTYARTSAWNFQQGSMLQWLPSGGQKLIIFNDLEDGRCISKIMDVNTSRVEELPFPIYAVHPDGERSLFLNFGRLDEVREGYGYKGIRRDELCVECPIDDGVFVGNLKTGESKLIISLSALYLNRFVSSMDDGKHWVDHLTWNPSGSRFAFFHRWQTKGGGLYSRLYTADNKGEGLFLLLDSGMASHFTWKNDLELIVWGREPGVVAALGNRSFVRKVGMPFYKIVLSFVPKLKQRISGDAFLKFRDMSNEFEKIGVGCLLEDGHPSISPNGYQFLTDKFSSSEHCRSLVLYDLLKNELMELAKFRSLPDVSFGVGSDWDSSSLRCDLHPRWSSCGKKICFDSVHEGFRGVYVLEVNS